MKEAKEKCQEQTARRQTLSSPRASTSKSESRGKNKALRETSDQTLNKKTDCNMKVKMTEITSSPELPLLTVFTAAAENQTCQEQTDKHMVEAN